MSSGEVTVFEYVHEAIGGIAAEAGALQLFQLPCCIGVRQRARQIQPQKKLQKNLLDGFRSRLFILGALSSPLP
jgi:hypothetical protein